MGLLVTTDFETAQGFHVTSVYLRIVKLVVDNIRPGVVSLTVQISSHISREKRLSNVSPINVPGMLGGIILQTPLASAVDFQMLYGRIKTELAKQGFASEDVLEPAVEPEPITSTEAVAQTTSEITMKNAFNSMDVNAPIIVTEPAVTEPTSTSQQSSESTP